MKAVLQANGISNNASEVDPNSNEAPAERVTDGEGNGKRRFMLNLK